ncbi:peroxiredoxin [Sphingomonas gilva]|uniref:thioredoxin-dependent peroxiredoxin n=1 Tax=Sphingomonas gilva TaxID=2305907 RepID=A0A396RNH1_9SPHN|nr:peroxiredoxin [Sphingomonas gilva]RHW18024.1 peroxiredoxin [Sphingomonas gilva]
MPLSEGDRLPALMLTGADGETIDLAKLRGKPLVLYFYPKADTPGCTREAQDFSELAPAFAKAGAAVIGVSRDEPKKLAKFSGKYDLTARLASDAGELSDAFGFWGEKSMYGRTFMGMERATVLVDADGRIARIWRKVKVPGHAQSVLDAVASQ